MCEAVHVEEHCNGILFTCASSLLEKMPRCPMLVVAASSGADGRLHFTTVVVPGSSNEEDLVLAVLMWPMWMALAVFSSSSISLVGSPVSQNFWMSNLGSGISHFLSPVVLSTALCLDNCLHTHGNNGQCFLCMWPCICCFHQPMDTS